MTTLLFGLLVVLAAGFAFLNGFHDVSNAVAPAVRTRALTPRIAVGLSAVFTFLGVLLGGGFATVFLISLRDLPHGSPGLAVLLCAALASIGWGVLTWWRGMPSSSTQALIGGLVGALFADSLLGRSHGVDYLGSLWWTVFVPLLLSPLIAFVLGALVIVPVIRFARNTSPSKINARSRSAQSVFTAAFSLGHGMQDGQRTVLLLVLGLGCLGVSTAHIPLWSQLFAALFLALGALAGGWRISYTIGHRLIRVDPARAMTAQGVSTVLLYASALWLYLPVSSTQTLASALVGTGVYQRFLGFRLRTLVRMILVWITTAPATAVTAAILYLALSPITG